MRIAIVGGGHLGSAIARGLREANPSAGITVSQPLVDAIRHLEPLGIRVTASNAQGVSGAELVVVAVKPSALDGVLRELRESLQGQILVSVVTGKPMRDIEQAVGPNTPIVRAMPNLAIAHGQSMTCICHQHTSDAQLQLVLELFNSLGETVLVDEGLMDACTVMAGSGIAFALRFIRAAMQGGVAIGLDAQTARLMANQVVRGATALLDASGDHPEQAIDRVATPKGCTIAGLNGMEQEGFSAALIAGIQRAYQAIEAINKQ